MQNHSSTLNFFDIRTLTTLTLFSVIGMSTPLYAGADAGQLLQQIEKERGAPLPPKASPIITPEEMKVAPDGQKITITSFKYVGNTLLSSQQLDAIVASYLNRPVSFAELQQAMTDITNAYRLEGWLIRSYLPRQDITEGIVTIQIVEAVFGKTRLEGSDLTRLNSQQLINLATESQASGESLNTNALDRALLLMDDLPGVTVIGRLGKGSGENETDLVLKMADEKLLVTDFGIDNAGSRSTGYERVTADFYLNSPLGLGDQATANLIHSQGNDYGRLAYSMPLGNDGWRMGVSGSYLSYDLINSDFDGLDAKGSSSTLGVNANYPIIRSRLKNLFLGVNLDHNQFDNEANQATTTKYDINSLSLSLNGNLYDKLGGGGANAAGLRMSRGDVDLDEINLAEDPLLDGNFTKFTYYLSRQQVITDSTSLYLSLSGQESNTNLDSSEKFYLGGAYGVRAYPTSEGAGDEGQLVNIELRHRLPYNLNLTGFYDWGHVTVNHDNAQNDSPNSVDLKGAGLSLAWQGNSDQSLKLTWAHRLGNNPNPILNGDDQDGSHHTNRFWLQASMQF